MRISDWSSDVCSSDLRRRDRAARFQRRQVKRMAFLDFRPLAHEQRIAVPADRIGASAEQIDGDIIALLVEHMRRDSARAGTQTPVGLWQRDDIGREFAETLQHSTGGAARVETNYLSPTVHSAL